MSAPAAVVTPPLPSAASLLPLATSILRNHHDAEDAVQDALVKMLVAEAGYQGTSEASRKCWERTVLKRTAIDLGRDKFRKIQKQEPFANIHSTNPYDGHQRWIAVNIKSDHTGVKYGITPSHEAATGDRETLERIFAAASPEELDVLRLRADGYTYEEIASLLGVGSQTPKVRMFRLRKRLERQGFKR